MNNSDSQRPPRAQQRVWVLMAIVSELEHEQTIPTIAGVFTSMDMAEKYRNILKERHDVATVWWESSLVNALTEEFQN